MDEKAINIITNTTVPEGIWFNQKITLNKATRIFGEKEEKGTISLEVKRLYRLTDIPNLANRAVKSCHPKIINIFSVSQHIVAFVVNPKLFRQLKLIKKELIRYVRKAKEKSRINCLSLFILLGNENMMYFK